MKKTLYLYLIGCLALLPAAEASTVLMDLSPVDSGTTGLNANGITPADVWGYDLMSWHGRSRFWQTRLHSAPGLSVCRLGARPPRTLAATLPGSNFLWPLPPLLLPCPLILPEAARGVPLSLNAPTRATFTGLPPTALPRLSAPGPWRMRLTTCLPMACTFPST